MWTMPVIEGEEIIDIYHQNVGDLISPTVIDPVLSISLKSPGKLGTITIPEPYHIVRVMLLMKKKYLLKNCSWNLGR